MPRRIRTVAIGAHGRLAAPVGGVVVVVAGVATVDAVVDDDGGWKL